MKKPRSKSNKFWQLELRRKSYPRRSGPKYRRKPNKLWVIEAKRDTHFKEETFMC